MDLIADRLRATKRREIAANFKQRTVCLYGCLFGSEHRFRWQKPHASYRTAAFAVVWVADAPTHHLIAATYAEHRRPGGMLFQNLRLQAALAQPFQVAHGALGAGQQD